jgi:hypothetical protein
MLSAVGDNRLMPKAELDCMLINADSGYRRTNHSWVLSRLLRDFDHWRTTESAAIEADKLTHLINANKRLNKPRDATKIRIALCVTIWECPTASGRGFGDFVYWVGLAVTAVQLCLAIVPLALYGEWFTLFITVAGTLLAYGSSSLPQWCDEKMGVRSLERPKDVFLTEGNGSRDVLLIRCSTGALDFEALAGSQRRRPHYWNACILSIILAALWIALLITVAGWDQHTWYILGVGMIGMLHNVAVAGIKRQPRAWGINLVHSETITDDKVMKVLWAVETSCPKAGSALVDEFFTSQLNAREKLLWQYAQKRGEAWMAKDSATNGIAKNYAWPMPPLQRPTGGNNDDNGDIPDEGPYQRPS